MTEEAAPGNVLITGAASGIGRAMADAFDRDGYGIWVTDVDDRALAGLPVHWNKRRADAADEPTMAAVFAELADDDGGLFALCANAGVAGPTAPIENVALDDWRRCVSVNLEGAFLAAKHATPLMKRAGAGSIVVTSSTAGQYGYPQRAPYVAAKWAVIGLMKTLAAELGPFGIRANAICPGAVEGPRMEGVLQREAEAKGTTRDALYRAYASGTSMGRWVSADDIAEMAVFLCSNRARLVSGQVIAIDGNTENPDPKV